MLRQCSQQLQDLNVECTKLRKKVEVSCTKFHDVTNQIHHLSKKYELSKAKASKLKDRNAQLAKCAFLFQELDEESDSESDTSG